MSKYNKLLNKAVSFEKLALYSDRKAFLQALGQEASDPNKELALQALTAMQQENVDNDTLKPLYDAVNLNKLDLNAVKKAITHALLFYTVKTPQNREKLEEILKELNNQQASEKTLNMPEDHITGSLPMNKEDQAALAKFYNYYVINGYGVPLAANSSPDVQSKQQLAAFKKFMTEKNKNPNYKLSDKEALELVKQLANTTKSFD